MENKLKNIEESKGLQEKIANLTSLSKVKKRLIGFAVILICFILTIFIAWISGVQQSKAKMAELEEYIKQLEDNPIVVNPVAPEINLQVIYSEIENIGELATTEYLFTDAGVFKDSQQIKNWNIPLTEKSFTMKWDGIIKAGVKLDLVKIDVNEINKKILVSIPAAEILSYEVKNMEVLDEKNNIFNQITVDDTVDFNAATEEDMRKRAIENGLLEKAQVNAEDILRRLLTSTPAVTDDYTIEFSVIE